MFKKNLNTIKKNVLKSLNFNYAPHVFDEKNLTLLNEGKFANATVFHYKDELFNLTIKDFSGSPLFVRDTFGRLFINHEANIMMKLSNNKSVAKNVRVLSPYTVAFNFIEGAALKKSNNSDIPELFFIELEKNIKDMHEHNIVHLDLRNLGNIILGEDNYPYIIDFQSAISTKSLGKRLANILKISDITGVYKCWKKRCSVPLDQERENIFEEFNKIRKIWIFRGYPISRAIKKIKNSLNLKKVN